MVKHIGYGAKTTAELLAQLQAAGEGCELWIIPKGTQDGAIKFYLSVRPATHLTAKEEDCPPILNESYVCPPICP